MLVTLPFVLLLLDYWPLRRMALAWRLVVEKLPLLALSAASCVATSLAQESATARLDLLPLGWRVANALTSYAAYLRMSVYPASLAVFYPYSSEPLSIGPIAGALLILAGVSAAVMVWRRTCPWLFVGWCWYLGMLVPVIGLVQVGRQALADRYTYLPQIGLLIAVAWTAKRALASRTSLVWAGRVAAALIVATLMGCAWRQTSYWRNGETLWRRALDCTSGESIAGNNLGTLLLDQGRLVEAIACLRDALRTSPNDVMLLNNLAMALNDQENHAEAMALLEHALQLQPNELHTRRNLGVVLASAGRFDEAVARYRAALEIKPDDAKTHRYLGTALLRTQHFEEAIDHFRKALAVEPDMADVHNNLAFALARRGRLDEAISHYKKAAALQPDAAEPHNNLGACLARQGRFDEAIAQFNKALELKPDYAEARRSLDFVRARRDAGQKSGIDRTPE
jgi:tetratricopeptide (TPR) repeat protein